MKCIIFGTAEKDHVHFHICTEYFCWLRKAIYLFKVIPLFCTAHPLLRIRLPHPRWRRFFPLARKEQLRAAFAELKLLFGWQLPGLLSKNKKMKEMRVIRSLQWFFTSRPSSCGIIKMSWLRLWIMGGCEACGTALRLSNCINEPVSGLGSLLYICCSNSESGETNISGKIRPTVAPEPREGDQSLM